MEESKIRELIMEEINKVFELGEHTGGSGHKAYLGLTIHGLKQEQQNGLTKVTYQYSFSRESEFTVYGEGDPEPDIYEVEMIIEDNKVISSKSREVNSKSVPMPEEKK